VILRAKFDDPAGESKSMARDDALRRGRESFERRAWREARALLSAADRESPLEPHDLERLATAAYLAGEDAHSTDLWPRAHHGFLARGDAERAARCAFWLAFQLLNRGEAALGSGWLARARRVLDDGGQQCVVHGYLLLPDGIRHIGSGNAAAACDTFREAAALGTRFGDTDLVALARHGEGRALIRMGKTTDGVALLDEVMVAVTAGELSAMVVGDVYCSVIEGCHEIFDLRRAHEWTEALARWCASQPDLVPYRGQCLVRRAEILQLHGAWPDAMDEASRACEWLARPPVQPAIGAAYYQRAELHRLRGELEQAEDAYRQASHWGRKPQPGLALLRLTEGRVEAASAAIHNALGEAREPRSRVTLLGACVEIALAAGDVAGARAAADEMAEIAADLDAPFLRAVAAHGAGVVLLREGDAQAALTTLRDASSVWRDLDAPYEAARARVEVARACRALGDEDGAAMELDAARRVFERLGAAPDLARLVDLSSRSAPEGAGRLTAREIQVLGLVATGKTNRAIAATLGLSEKTVARHLSNIFTKLDLSSRAAATAYAYRHHLV